MLDLRKYFREGEKFQISYVDSNGHSHEYVSQVIQLYENEFMDVLIPIHKKRDVYLRQDAVLKLSIPKGEAVYEFKSIIYEKIFGRIPLLKLRVSSEVSKIQRRNFYRLKLMRDIEARIVEDIKERKYGERFKGNMRDISAGGLLLSFKKELYENSNLEITLDLNGKKLIVFGTVIRRISSADFITEYVYGVKYYRISEYERNEITKFIFEEQRKLIKKGLV